MTAATAAPNAAAMTAAILSTWERATPAQREAGAQWYDEAQSIAATLAAQAGRTIDVAAAVIAHLSPRTTWARNVSGATSLMLNGDAPGCMGANVTRALAAMASDDALATLNGPKTAAFADNIMGDAESVTVDVWALRVALGADADERVLSRKGGYAAVAAAYRAAAARVGVSPATMQAATWIVARNGRVA